MAADLSPHDAVLDEAALRFAEGDAQAAAQALRTALADLATDATDATDLLGAQALHDTLLDLYCATGEAARFEALALEGAQRFGTSPPAWVDLPQQWAASSVSCRAPWQRSGHVWQAPACLRARDLPAVPLEAGSEVLQVLDWSRLLQVDAAAVAALTACLHAWADVPSPLVLLGVEAIEAWIDRALQAPDALQPPWLLRLAWLRVLGQADAFEVQALAYCQRFEQSPPAWVPPFCTVLAAHQIQTPVPAAAAAETEVEQPRLGGEVLGDAMPQLAALLVQGAPPGPVRVDCTLLLRMDFAAAGALLNWAAQRQAAGQSVALLHLHRPLARLLQLLGVDAYATLHLRK